MTGKWEVLPPKKESCLFRHICRRCPASVDAQSMVQLARTPRRSVSDSITDPDRWSARPPPKLPTRPCKLRLSRADRAGARYPPLARDSIIDPRQAGVGQSEPRGGLFTEATPVPYLLIRRLRLRTLRRAGGRSLRRIPR